MAGWCGLGWILERFAPNFHHRHVSGLWFAPRWHSLWVFVLLIAIAVWCVHAAIRLRETIADRGLRGQARKRAVAFGVGHSIGVLGLGAYVGFVIAAPSEEFVVTEKGLDVHGEFYRALRIEAGSREPRARRPPVAWLERRVGTTVDQIRVVRGTWWSSRAASFDLALTRAHWSTDGAVFRHGQQRVTLKINQPVKRGLVTLLLRALHHHHQEPSAAPERAELDIGGEHKVLPVDPEWAGENAFLGMKETPVLLLRVHRNFKTQLAVLAATILGIAWLLRRRQSADAPGEHR